MIKFFFNWNNVLGTLVVFTFIGILNVVAVNLDFLNAFEQTLSDFRLTDLYFSRILDPAEVTHDDNIVVVNFGELPRAGIAAQIDILSQFEPKCIGLDAMLFKDLDPEQDSIMEAVLASRPNVVFVSRLVAGKKDSIKNEVSFEIKRPIPRFLKHLSTGYANLITEGESMFETCRTFSPQEKLHDGTTELCFAAKLASYVDSTKVNNFLARGNKTEMINYRRNWQKYTILDVEDVFKEAFQPELLKGKVILMGYLGKDYMQETWSEDRFYTPLNTNVVGRTHPDMYGVLVHANIISMILSESYLQPTPEWVSILLAIILCYVNVAFFVKIYYSETFGTWYDVITKLTQFIQAVIFSYLILHCLEYYNIMLDITLGILTVVLAGDVLEVFLAILANIRMKMSRRS